MKIEQISSREMAGNLTESTVGNITISTTVIPTQTVVYDYMDFELPILVVVTVLFCLSAFVLCTRARRNWNRRLRERNNQIFNIRRSSTSATATNSTASTNVSAYRNPGFSCSNSSMDNIGIHGNPDHHAYVIPTAMIMPPTYIDLPPSYEDVIKETNNSESTQTLQLGYVENSSNRQTNPLGLQGSQPGLSSEMSAPGISH